jgi:hypothetical protein
MTGRRVGSRLSGRRRSGIVVRATAGLNRTWGCRHGGGRHDDPGSSTVDREDLPRRVDRGRWRGHPGARAGDRPAAWQAEVGVGRKMCPGPRGRRPTRNGSGHDVRLRNVRGQGGRRSANPRTGATPRPARPNGPPCSPSCAAASWTYSPPETTGEPPPPFTTPSQPPNSNEGTARRWCPQRLLPASPPSGGTPTVGD